MKYSIKRFSILLICFLAVLGSSCKKDKVQPLPYAGLTRILENKTWAIQEISLVAPLPTAEIIVLGDSTKNFKIPACLKDNQYRFQRGGNLEILAGEDKCPNEPNNGRWRLSEFKGVLSMNISGQTDAFQIFKYNTDTLRFFQAYNETPRTQGLYFVLVNIKN